MAKLSERVESDPPQQNKKLYHGEDLNNFSYQTLKDLGWSDDQLKENGFTNFPDKEEVEKPIYKAENVTLTINGVEIPCFGIGEQPTLKDYLRRSDAPLAVATGCTLDRLAAEIGINRLHGETDQELKDRCIYGMKGTPPEILNGVNTVLNINNTGENNMTTRKIVTATLIDDDLGLPVEHSVVTVLEGIVTEDNDQVTIQQILMDHPIKEAIDEHNKKRATITDNKILETTGNDVKLRPVQLKDLRWTIK